MRGDEVGVTQLLLIKESGCVKSPSHIWRKIDPAQLAHYKVSTHPPTLPPCRSFPGDDLNSKGQNFIRLLAENKRLVLLPEIAALYEILKANQEKSVDVEITTAFEISSDIAEKLANSLRSRLEREINLATKVDQSLLGGAVIRAGDTVIDSSVRGKLTKLAESINS